VQEVMLGYSDSNRKRLLQSACAVSGAASPGRDGQANGGAAAAFHDRGGAIGRGGGREPGDPGAAAAPWTVGLHQSRRDDRGPLPGHPAIAERHLEQVLNAVLRSSFNVEEDRPEPGWNGYWNGWRNGRAGTTARGLRHAGFLTYFEQATPIAEIEAVEDRLPAGARVAAGGIDQCGNSVGLAGCRAGTHFRLVRPGRRSQRYLTENPDDRATLQQMYRRSRSGGR
jgi:phosphoenolpyruvate carboxylase